MKDFTQLANLETVSSTKMALEKNGFQVLIAENSGQAKKLFFETVPKGASVMNNTSRTLQDTGIQEVLENSEDYISIHKKTLEMDREKDGAKIKGLRSVSNWAVGSFHAVTQDGHIMMASGSGSQIPGYAYGADHVVFVAGTHKIVKNLEEGFERIYNHSLPLESERINQVYNTTSGSNPRRILIMNTEANSKRTTVILVKEVLGF